MNLPVNLDGKRLFVAGMGGGQDLLGGLLFEHEHNLVGLGSLNTQARGFHSRSIAASDDVEFPVEGAVRGLTGLPVYVFAKEGVQSVRKGYQRALDALGGIDAVILVDGGVDSLMRGDEREPGTLLEDTVSLAAVARLPVKEKYLVCLGFGTEVEEQVCHYRALENIANLTKAEGFLGSFSLTKRMEAYQYYSRIARAVFESPVRKSHIHTRIIPAVEGEFGTYRMYSDIDPNITGLGQAEAWINPLMGICWFFDLETVARQSVLVPHLEPTGTWTDVMMVYKSWRPSQRQFRESLPLPL